MSVDCPFPSPLDLLLIYDVNDILLMELPLCEVIRGDVESIDKETIKMQSFETKEITTYSRNDFLLEIQNLLEYLNIAYAEIITKDNLKIRI